MAPLSWLLTRDRAATRTWWLLCAFVAVGARGAAVYKPAVVLVATFPSEYHRWLRRLPLGDALPFHAGAGEVPLGWNASLGILGVVTGMGPRNAALTITALGHDPRFDLTKSYWLLAGISGIDPAMGCVGGALWANYLVDGDAAKFIDPREAPRGWPTGWMPLNRSSPYGTPPSEAESADVVYKLDPKLVTRAFNRTRGLRLPDPPALQPLREKFAREYPSVLRGPSVALGATLSTNAIWEGRFSTDWARNWTRYWTKGKATFAASLMEDTGVAAALTRLEHAGAAMGPSSGLLVLRTASNFVEPPPGVSAAAFMLRTGEVSSTPFEAAFEAAFLVGAPVVLELARQSRVEKGPELVTLVM